MIALAFYAIAAAALSNAAWLAWGRSAQVATARIVKAATKGARRPSITFAS